MSHGTRLRSMPAMLCWVLLAAVANSQEGSSAATTLGPGGTINDEPLQIVALANEGFLLRCDVDAVLIDAFLAEPYSIYDALPPTVLKLLLGAQAPFDSVDLALVSHVHGDHFQPAPARRFLDASPQTLLASSPQVLAALAAYDLAAGDLSPGDGDNGQSGSTGNDGQAGDSADGDNNDNSGGAGGSTGAAPSDLSATTALFPTPGQSKSMTRDFVVEFLHLSHGTGRFASIENLGHVITLGGRRILHLGDAAMEPANFAPFAATLRDVDVALIPYWYFLSSAGRALLTEYVDASLTIACHVPGEERDDVIAALAASHPDVIVARDVLQSWDVPAAEAAARR